jgi:hypothetical protein
MKTIVVTVQAAGTAGMKLVEVVAPSCLTSTTTTAKRLDNWAPATRYRRRSLTSVIQWRGASVTTGSMGSISPTYRRFPAMRRMTSSSTGVCRPCGRM